MKKDSVSESEHLSVKNSLHKNKEGWESIDRLSSPSKDQPEKEELKLPSIHRIDRFVERSESIHPEGLDSEPELDHDMENMKVEERKFSGRTKLHSNEPKKMKSAEQSEINLKSKVNTKSKIKHYFMRILNNMYYTIFMTVITIYALFGDDLRLVVFSKEVDPYFYGVTSACLLFFSFEIVLASIAKEDYFLKFYFWLDAMATVSLISDIGWIWDRIVGNQDFSASNAQQASQLARAGRGARVGTRAGRIIRIIRLIRLIRVVKLYKHAHVALLEKPRRHDTNMDLASQNDGDHHHGLLRRGGTENFDNRSNISHQMLRRRHRSGSQSLSENSQNAGHHHTNTENEIDKEDYKLPEESRVGKKLSDLTTKRVIILVLAMMFSFPLFTYSTYTDENDSFTFGLEAMKLFSSDPLGIEFQTSYSTYLNEHKNLRTPLISLYVEIDEYNLSWDSDKVDPTDLRFTEADVASIDGGDYVAIFDLRKNTRLSAGLSIGRTVFV
jgi:hypothetical protein